MAGAALCHRGREAEAIGPPSNVIATSAGAGWIDDFRLWGSRPCRRIHAPLKKGGVAHKVAHAFDNPNAPLSEGGALAVVVKSLPGKPDWTRVGTDCPHPLRQAWRGGAPRVPASPGALHGREECGGSDPPLFSAGAPPARVKRRVQ